MFIPDINNVAAAVALENSVKAGAFGPKNSLSRNTVNGALEAFYVTHLMAQTPDALGSALAALKAQVGTRNSFIRGVARVRAARSQNPAWRSYR